MQLFPSSTQSHAVWMQRRTPLLCRWSSTGTDCPDRVGLSLVGDTQEPSQCKPVPGALGWVCLSRENGPDDPLWHTPTPPILWFCHSAKHLQLLLFTSIYQLEWAHVIKMQHEDTFSFQSCYLEWTTLLVSTCFMTSTLKREEQLILWPLDRNFTKDFIWVEPSQNLYLLAYEKTWGVITHSLPVMPSFPGVTHPCEFSLGCFSDVLNIIPNVLCFCQSKWQACWETK